MDDPVSQEARSLAYASRLAKPKAGKDFVCNAEPRAPREQSKKCDSIQLPEG
jgi:hypothetical protein